MNDKKTNKKLWSNFFSLSFMQMFSYVFPLITIPYLTRVLGVEKFGLVMYAQIVNQYFVLLSDYGFGLSATKEIAQNIDDQKKINEIFSAVFVIKFIFLLICLIILFLLISFIPMFKEEWKLFIFAFGVVIGQFLFPVWFFQGLEKMYITAIINIVPKFIFTLCIFILVTTSDDYILVPIINAFGFIISGILALWLAIKKFNVKFIFPSIEGVIFQLKEGWHVFLGIISSNFAIFNVTFILGLLTSPVIVGYYAAVEKIIRPLASLSRPVINAIFPYQSKLVKKSLYETYLFSKKVTLTTSTVFLLIGVILFIFSKPIVFLVFGRDYQLSIEVLKIMAFLPFINSVLHVFAIPNMILFGLKKIYSKIMFFNFILSIILSFLFIKWFNLIGASLVVVFLDIFVLVLFVFLIHKKLKGIK